MSNLLEKASIITTPTAYSEGKLHSVKPEQTVGSELNADLDFQRSTNATRLNSQGLIENVGVDLARIDYTDGCGSLLLERYSTNFITRSEDISGWFGSPINTVIEASSETFPDGLNNGFKIYANTSPLTNHFIEPNPRPPAAAGENATLSFFVKSAGSDFIQIATSSGFPARYQNFNISTGTKASGDVSGSSITDYGNGWYRISVTEVVTGTSARYLIIPILSDGGRNPRFAGTANQDGVYIWGVQAEREVSKPSSYIPTSGTIATRIEDDVSRTGLSPYINGVEGTFYFEGRPNSTANITLYTSVNQRLWIEFNENDTRAFLNNGSGAVNLNINSETVDFDSYRKVAFSYKENEFKLYVNGVGNAITPTQTTFGVNDLDGIDLGIGNKFYGNVKELAVFKEALTDEELSELTTI